MNLEVGRQDVPLEVWLKVGFYEAQRWENNIPLTHFYILFALIKNHISNDYIKINKSDLDYIKQLEDLLITCCNDKDDKIRKDFSLIGRCG